MFVNLINFVDFCNFVEFVDSTMWRFIFFDSVDFVKFFSLINFLSYLVISVNFVKLLSSTFLMHIRWFCFSFRSWQISTTSFPCQFVYSVNHFLFANFVDSLVFIDHRENNKTRFNPERLKNLIDRRNGFLKIAFIHSFMVLRDCRGQNVI